MAVERADSPEIAGDGIKMNIRTTNFVMIIFDLFMVTKFMG
jgi:hypothetical protein